MRGYSHTFAGARRWLSTIIALILIGFAGTASAQTINTTTLAADATASTITLTVASGTGITAGQQMLIDQEGFTVVSISSVTVTVNRAYTGLAAVHGNGSTVFFGPPYAFAHVDVESRACNPSGSAAPYINIETGRIWQCSPGGQWRNLTQSPAPGSTGTVMAGAGTASSPTFTSTPTVTTLTTTNLNVTGILSTNVDGIATTSTDGLVLQDGTAATSGATVQMSPRVKFRGNAWDTAASQTVDFFLETLPATAATPTGTFNIGYSRNGGAATLPMTVSSAGVATVLSSYGLGGTGFVSWNSRSALSSPSNGTLNIINGANTAGIGIDVTTDSTIKFRTRAQSADGHVSAASVRGNAVAFASLPATPVEGMLVGVTDSNTATWGATVAAGGANHILAYYNGTNWTVAGK